MDHGVRGKGSCGAARCCTGPDTLQPSRRACACTYGGLARCCERDTLMPGPRARAPNMPDDAVLAALL